jgi:hypothetical protein
LALVASNRHTRTLVVVPTIASVTDSNDPVTLDSWDRTGGLQRLAADYPAFRFRIQQGWDRTRLRWVAERIRGLDEGLHTAITTDLAELRAALGNPANGQNGAGRAR